MSQNPIIIFVCEHGAAKSIIAAAYFNKLANMTTSEPTNIPDESYLKLFLRFLRFGLLAWGGPVSQIAMIRQEIVDDEKWITSEKFNRVLAIYQALPGPEAHELCVYFGM